MSSKSRNENHSDAPLSPAIQASDSGISHNRDPPQSHFTFRYPLPTPPSTPMRGSSSQSFQMPTNSRNEDGSEVIEASDSRLPHTQDPPQLYFTFRYPIPTPPPTPKRAGTPNDNESETPLFLLESVSIGPLSSRDDRAKSRAHTRSAMSVC